MKSRITLILIALMTLSAILMGQDRPNIVFIFADDFGRSDISSYHLQTRGVPGGAPTPNIEALIDEGMWFTDAHSPTALCAPSRYAVMTGNYNIRSSSPGGIWGHFSDNTMTNSDVTIGQVVKREGYHTGFIGKWHFGGDYYELNSNNIYRGNEKNALGQVDFNTWVSNNPNDLGFDYDFTLPHGIQGPSYLAYENGQWYPLGANSSIIYLDDTNIDPYQLSAKGEGPGDSNWDAYDVNELIVDKAVNFINNASQQANPFFLYYSATSVHIPHTAPDYIEGEAFAGTTVDPLTDMIKVFDWEVKKIVDALKANGEYENTIIIFTSDNGGLNYAKDNGHFSSGNLRGDKRDPYEGGHRIPLIVTWPCVVPAGSTSDHMINGTDFLATFAGIAGGSITSNEAKDSHNFLQILLGDNSYQPRTEMINQGASGPRTATIRDGDWKLIFESNGNLNANFNPTHLFDLSTNLSENESANYINDAAYTSRKNDMMNRFIQLRNSNTRSVPINSATFDPANVPMAGSDIDNDGICDAVDTCPNFDNNLIGISCDDGDDCTINDVYTTNCICEGTSISIDDVTLTATADAYVRGGTYENNNYGTGGLATKKSSNAQYTRQSYIKFDLTGHDATGFLSATLQLTVTDNSNGTISQTISHVGDDSWTESGITWSNQPNNSTLITNFDISNAISTASVDISADVLSTLNGDKTISLLLEGVDTQYIIYANRESASQGPTLILTYDDCDSAACSDSDNDGICNADDNTNGPCTLNTSCDDGDVCTTGDAYDANCNCTGTLIDDNNNNICDIDECINIELYAYLEGAYDPILDEMRNTLVATRKLLPGQTPTSGLATPTPAGQPYNIAPWNYAGTEGAGWTNADYTGDETDWILVSFRTGTAKSTEVGMTAGLLMKDGSITFPDRCALTSTVASPLYILVEHRNHIGVMTPQPIDVIGSTLTYDFRLADSYRDPTSFGQKQLPTGEWVMFAGDADQSDFPSFDIKGTDKTIWFDNNGVFDYYFSPDFNLDGDINGQDKSLWFENNGISSRVPKG